MNVQTNATVVAKSINVRKEAHSDAERVTTLHKGDRIQVVSGEKDKYPKIILPECHAYGNYGKYIEMDSEKEDPPMDDYLPNAVCTANSYVNIRDGRDKDCKDIGNLNAEEECMVLDDDLNNKYTHIRTFSGIDGYAYCNYGRYIKLKVALKEPTTLVKQTLEIVRGCVGGKYIYGAQGHKITTAYVKARYKAHPEYFSGGRYQMLLGIAAKCEAANHWNFPEDYAWDCSGLFWYVADKLDLFGPDVRDRTAHGTYHEMCIPVSRDEVRAGDLAFKENSSGRITHMAVIDSTGVHEAMSGYVGVITGDDIDDRTAIRLPGVYKEGQKYTTRPWTHFGRPKCFA